MIAARLELSWLAGIIDGGRRSTSDRRAVGDVTMADVAFFPGKLVNPAEAALKWVDMAQKGCKAWTDASLEILQTYSAVVQTQRTTLAALVPSAALVPPTPAETDTVVAEVVEAPPAPAIAAKAMEEPAEAIIEAPARPLPAPPVLKEIAPEKAVAPSPAAKAAKKAGEPLAKAPATGKTSG
jgi:hypothetical protein